MKRIILISLLAVACGFLPPGKAEEGKDPRPSIGSGKGERMIAPRRLEWTSPRGGEKWSVDSLHYLTWRSQPEVSAVRIDYSVDGGKHWKPVIHATDGRAATAVPSSPEGPNRWLWKVPSLLTSQGRLRIRQARQSAGEGVSEADFQIIPSQEVRSYRWTPVTLEAAFAGRDGAGAVVFKDRMWLLGGWNPRDKVHFPHICNSEVWSSADGLNWTLELPQAPWEGRHTAGYAGHDGRIWIVGGDCLQGHYQNDVWSSPDGVHWTLVCKEVPWGPRVLHHTLVYQDRIWVMGGQTLPQFAPGPEEAFYNDVWNTPDGVSWRRVTEHADWSPRGMIGGSVVFQGQMWLLGGGTYDTPTTPTRKFFNDVWSSTDGVHWKRHVEFAPWEPRQYHEVAAFDGRMWVLEGYDGQGNRNDVWYSADGVNWYELPHTPWAPRHAASVFIYRDSLWMVAGNNMFPDVWRLTRQP